MANGIYNDIKTARELVLHVKFHGLSTNQDDLCRVQDIFGHSTAEELEDLANDIGRNNENGEPDPNGSWSSGRVETRNVFYSILFQIWHWEDAVRFWNQHTNPEHDELNVLRAEHKDLAQKVCFQSAQIEGLQQELFECRKALDEQTTRANTAEQIVEKTEAEIVRLKAKLYDMLEK